MKYNGLRLMTASLRGERPGPEGAIGHVFNAEYSKRLQHFVMALLGPYGQLMRGAKNAYQHGRWGRSFLAAPGGSIATGTSGINRNVTAQRVLGMPR
jgi:alkylation response protein AidB-like acyl-CoA dehydrogenase